VVALAAGINQLPKATAKRMDKQRCTTRLDYTQAGMEANLIDWFCLAREILADGHRPRPTKSGCFGLLILLPRKGTKCARNFPPLCLLRFFVAK
jgi:hypothetical protein